MKCIDDSIPIRFRRKYQAIVEDMDQDRRRDFRTLFRGDKSETFYAGLLAGMMGYEALRLAGMQGLECQQVIGVLCDLCEQREFVE